MSELRVTIPRLRKRAHLTLTELAARAGISRGYLSEIENGHKDQPSADIILRLADVLDVPFESLYAADPKPVTCHHYGVEWADPHLQTAVKCVACGKRFEIETGARS